MHILITRKKLNHWQMNFYFLIYLAVATCAGGPTEIEAYSIANSDSIGFPDVEKSIGAPIPITSLGTQYFIYRKSVRQLSNFSIQINDNYKVFFVSRLRNERRMVQWRTASEICNFHKRKLVSFKNEQDYNRMARQLFKISTTNRTGEFRINRRYWIGLNDLQKEDSWQWNGETKPTVVNQWVRGKQPLKGRNNYHCVLMWKTLRNHHMWKEEDCVKKYYFICQSVNSTST